MTGLSGQHDHKTKSLKNYWVSGHYLENRKRNKDKRRQGMKIRQSEETLFQRIELLWQEV